jgi:hypothetical protein
MEEQPPPPDPSLELGPLAERLNEMLRQGGASSAEQAFGMGCALGLGPIFLVLLILFIFKIINIILAFILLVMAILAVTGVAMLVAQTARQNGIRRVYLTSVLAEINQYLAKTSLSRVQFDQQVSKVLPLEAPLQAFLKDKEKA